MDDTDHADAAPAADAMQLPPPDWRPPAHWLAAPTRADLEAGWMARGFHRAEPSDWAVVEHDARDWAKWKADPDGYRTRRIADARRDVERQASAIRAIADRHGLAPAVVRAVLVEYLWNADEYEFPARAAIEDMRRATVDA